MVVRGAGAVVDAGVLVFPQRSPRRFAHRPYGNRSKSNSPSPKRGRECAAGGANQGRKRYFRAEEGPPIGPLPPERPT